MCNLDAEHAYFDYTHLHFSCLSDNANKRWSDELLETFGIEKDKMARIVSPFDVVGHIAEEFSRLTGLPTGIPVVAGCGDTAASTFGSGMFEREMVLDCAGTEKRILRKACALIKPVVDMEGVESVDLSE